MTSVYIFSLILCVSLVSINGKDLEIGTSVNSRLLVQEFVKLSSFPLKVRTKNFFFNSANATSVIPIKGIIAIDLDRSKASATVTAGGVGSTFVNIRMKSERGDGLNYQIQIFG